MKHFRGFGYHLLCHRHVSTSKNMAGNRQKALKTSPQNLPKQGLVTLLYNNGASFWTPKTRKTPSECVQKGFLDLELWR